MRRQFRRHLKKKRARLEEIGTLEIEIEAFLQDERVIGQGLPAAERIVQALAEVKEIGGAEDADGRTVGETDQVTAGERGMGAEAGDLRTWGSPSKRESSPPVRSSSCSLRMAHQPKP